MAITAKSSGKAPRELIEPGNYLARCYQMIQIGTVTENIMGVEKTLHKVRIGWELPTELRVFKEENGEQPLVINREYTLSLHEKSRLRADLKSWRGKDFTDEEAAGFDISKLIGKTCMLNIIHKPSKDNTRFFEEIAGVATLPKGYECPEAYNPPMLLEYENFDWDLYDRLPDFIKDKIRSSEEFKLLQTPGHSEAIHADEFPDDDLPF